MLTEKNEICRRKKRLFEVLLEVKKDIYIVSVANLRKIVRIFRMPDQWIRKKNFEETIEVSKCSIRTGLDRGIKDLHVWEVGSMNNLCLIARKVTVSQRIVCVYPVYKSLGDPQVCGKNKSLRIL